MNIITERFLANNALHIETVIDGQFYIVRGYKKGECYPADYIFTLFLAIKDGVTEAKAYTPIEPMRLEQLRVLRLFSKSLGCHEYIYERSDGEKLTGRVSVL